MKGARQAAAGRAAFGGPELKRKTDRAQRTPFSPYNLRLYRQTYFGIRDMLAPLVAEGRLCCLPMQEPREGRAWAIEVCPASTLKRLGLYASYKPAHPDHARQRAKILKALEDEGTTASGGHGIRIAARVKRCVRNDSFGGALDSILALRAAFRALLSGHLLIDRDDPDLDIEGCVYV